MAQFSKIDHVNRRQSLITNQLLCKITEYADVAQFSKIDHVNRRQSLITNQLLCKITEYADVAQLAEQLICNQQVIGSSPIIGFVPSGTDFFGPLAQLVRATGS